MTFLPLATVKTHFVKQENSKIRFDDCESLENIMHIFFSNQQQKVVPSLSLLDYFRKYLSLLLPFLPNIFVAICSYLSFCHLLKLKTGKVFPLCDSVRIS